MKRFFAALLTVVLLAGLIPASSLAASQYATVVGGWLRLRAGTSFDAETITSYYTDTVVEIIGNTGKWYRVKTPDGRTGYMYGDYLKLGSVGSSTSGSSAWVTSHNGYGVRLRKGPGTGYRVIKTYDVGTPVKVLEKGTYWCRININGTVGYMMTQFLNFGSSTGNGNETVLCYAKVHSTNGYGVRLRSGPSKTYGKIGVYSVGTTVAVLEKGKVWDRIRVGSRTGWMMNEFLRYQNVNEVTSVAINTLNPTVGTLMYVTAMSPSNATVSFDWMVGGVVKGTSATYTVSSADVGKSIQLRVNGYGSYSGSALSAATNAVLSNTQLSSVKLSTTAPVVGDVLKAEVQPANATVAYAWKVNGYQVSDAAEYTVTAADAGKVIELIVSGVGQYSGRLAAATAAVMANSTLTGVSIRNDSNPEAGAAPMVGDTLTAYVTPAQGTATFQWKRNGAAISGATGVSYNLTDADLGAQIGVTVTGYGAYTGEKTATISAAVVARPAKPTIDDYAMPDGMVGMNYATQLTAQGGGKLSWSITGGSLPEGLSLSETGAITGTPARDGDFTFTVKAANTAGSDEKSFTITIVPIAEPELVIGSLTLPAVEEGYAQPAPVAFTIVNNGQADAALQQLWVEGGNASAFAINENGSSTIPAGATDTSWTVQPAAGLAPGTYTTTLMVRYNDSYTASAVVEFTVKPQSGAPEVPETTYTITVLGGTADKASAKPGETVTITANEPAEGMVFSGWTYSVPGILADASVPSTTLSMPETDVVVTANYTAASTPEPEKHPVLTMDEIVLPSVEEGYAQPAPWPVEITNTGDGDASLTLLYTENGSAGSFLVNENGSSTIAAGAVDTTWTIQPAAGLSAGVYKTEFVVEYNGLSARANVTFEVKEKTPVLYQLTVENGSGSGSYAEGETVTVTADPAPEGMLFAGWNGAVADSASTGTTIVMPAADITVTALYKAKEKVKLAAPEITWSEDGTSVSWTAVEGAVEYRYYRVKADGTPSTTITDTATSYTFKNPGAPGDVFYVQAIGGEEYLDSDYASQTY